MTNPVYESRNIRLRSWDPIAYTSRYAQQQQRSDLKSEVCVRSYQSCTAREACKSKSIITLLHVSCVVLSSCFRRMVALVALAICEVRKGRNGKGRLKYILLLYSYREYCCR